MSEKDNGGNILCIALLNIVLPLQGAQIINTLCNQAAAIHNALFAKICHFIFSKSTSNDKDVDCKF